MSGFLQLSARVSRNLLDRNVLCLQSTRYLPTRAHLSNLSRLSRKADDITNLQRVLKDTGGAGAAFSPSLHSSVRLSGPSLLLLRARFIPGSWGEGGKRHDGRSVGRGEGARAPRRGNYTSEYKWSENICAPCCSMSDSECSTCYAIEVKSCDLYPLSNC